MNAAAENVAAIVERARRAQRDFERQARKEHCAVAPRDFPQTQSALEQHGLAQPMLDQPALGQPALEQPALEQPALEQPALIGRRKRLRGLFCILSAIVPCQSSRLQRRGWAMSATRLRKTIARRWD